MRVVPGGHWMSTRAGPRSGRSFGRKGNVGCSGGGDRVSLVGGMAGGAAGGVVGGDDDGDGGGVVVVRVGSCVQLATRSTATNARDIRTFRLRWRTSRRESA